MTLGHVYPLLRLSVHHLLRDSVNENKFLCTQLLTFILNDATMETLQPTKQNDMIANNNKYKVSKNKHTTDEDKNKQIHSQIKIHNEHLKNIN